MQRLPCEALHNLYAMSPALNTRREITAFDHWYAIGLSVTKNYESRLPLTEWDFASSEHYSDVNSATTASAESTKLAAESTKLATEST